MIWILRIEIAIQSLLKTNQDQPRVARSGWAVAAAIIPTSVVAGHESSTLLRVIEDYCNGAIEQVEMVETELTLFHEQTELKIHDLMVEIACRDALRQNPDNVQKVASRPTGDR